MQESLYSCKNIKILQGLYRFLQNFLLEFNYIHLKELYTLGKMIYVLYMITICRIEESSGLVATPGAN